MDTNYILLVEHGLDLKPAEVSRAIVDSPKLGSIVERTVMKREVVCWHKDRLTSLQYARHPEPCMNSVQWNEWKRRGMFHWWVEVNDAQGAHLHYEFKCFVNIQCPVLLTSKPELFVSAWCEEHNIWPPDAQFIYNATDWVLRTDTMTHRIVLPLTGES